MSCDLDLVQFQFNCSVVSDSLQPHGLQHTRPPCPSPAPGVYPNSGPFSRWCRPTISSSVVPFSCPQSFPASGSFQMSQLFASGGQSIGVSASTSVLPMNTQDSPNVVHWRREWQITSVFLPWEPHEQYKKAKWQDIERGTPQVDRCPICYWRSVEK